MKWQKLAKEDTPALAGVEIQLEWQDGNLASVTLTDAAGDCLKIAEGRYNGIQIMVPEVPTVWRVEFSTEDGLRGTFLFKDEYKAKDHAKELSERYSAVDCHATVSKIEGRKVEHLDPKEWEVPF